MKNKKLIKSVILFFSLLLIVLMIPKIVWELKAPMAKNVVMIDKTVPDETYREHHGFAWILNYFKITKKNLEPYDYKADYYGFYPLKNEQYETRELPKDLGNPDYIYLLDTYGVYHQEFYESNIKETRSQAILGGINEKEVESIEKALGNNSILGEFNILASPTKPAVRKRLESIFGGSWTGWIGRYFPDLNQDSPEVPPWMVENYVLQYGERWTFSGPGVVFLDANDNLVVLKENEIGKDFVKINYTDAAEKKLGVKNNVRYNYWFDVMSAEEGTEVLANYQLDLTEAGKKILNDYKIPLSFPAVMKKTGSYTAYYFSGDFADAKSSPQFYAYSGIPFLNKITTIEDDRNQNYFYWQVYYPMIKTILGG